jgi:hypothetical protein
MQNSPNSDAPEGGSQDAPSHEEADQRHARERDLMRELDQVTGRTAKAPHPRTAREHPVGAEEVPDECD